MDEVKKIGLPPNHPQSAASQPIENTNNNTNANTNTSINTNTNTNTQQILGYRQNIRNQYPVNQSRTQIASLSSVDKHEREKKLITDKNV